MLDMDIAPFAKNPTTLAPPELRAKIDETLDAIYPPINNGVYRAGFATSQPAYEEACTTLFAALVEWERVLATQRYMCGDVMTEADIALFTTLLRFDLVYYAHFKCNVRRMQDYPNLWGFLRDVYQTPAVKANVQPRSHQDALLLEPGEREPDAHRAARADAAARRAARPSDPIHFTVRGLASASPRA